MRRRLWAKVPSENETCGKKQHGGRRADPRAPNAAAAREVTHRLVWEALHAMERAWKQGAVAEEDSVLSRCRPVEASRRA